MDSKTYSKFDSNLDSEMDSEVDRVLIALWKASQAARYVSTRSAGERSW